MGGGGAGRRKGGRRVGRRGRKEMTLLGRWEYDGGKR